MQKMTIGDYLLYYTFSKEKCNLPGFWRATKECPKMIQLFGTFERIEGTNFWMWKLLAKNYKRQDPDISDLEWT